MFTISICAEKVPVTQRRAFSSAAPLKDLASASRSPPVAGVAAISPASISVIPCALSHSATASSRSAS
ncbi:MAG: hypothetical protein MZV64_28510 [Ignavibacteriales bacterium]|nr:hypothetical protein [Ignavibacteriales bacterium]